MHIKLEIEIPPEQAGLRCDQALAQLLPQYSRARLQTWLKAGQITLNDKSLRPNDKVRAGQVYILETEIAADPRWQAEPIELTIVYEDADLLVINKPAGLVVHPGAGNQDHTLVNALLHFEPALATVPRAGIVHRIDKDTSGLLVVARNLHSHKELVKALAQHAVKREYIAIAMGVITSGGSITTNIGRHPNHRTRMAVIGTGKPAITHFRVLERFRAHTYIKVELETGRTHQIRVHMAHIRHPLVGDPVYGGGLKIPAGISEELKTALQNFKRQALHAQALNLTHPISGELMHWQAEPPEDIQRLVALLRVDCDEKG